MNKIFVILYILGFCACIKAENYLLNSEKKELEITQKIVKSKATVLRINNFIKNRVKCNALIMCFEVPGTKEFPAESYCTVRAGETKFTGKLRIVNQSKQGRYFDLEMSLEKTVYLDSDSQLFINLLPKTSGLVKLQAILPVMFHKNDLSRKINFEIPGKSGVWLSHAGAGVSLSNDNVISGSKSLKAFWPGANGVVSFIPGERDWSNYVELRFKVANRMPTVEGRRKRVCFLFDGKASHRPTVNDTLPQGVIELLEESGKTFTLDLVKLKNNNPKINLKDIRSFSISWSPVVCGETVFFIDEIELVKKEAIEAERTAKTRNGIADLESMADQLKSPDARYEFSMKSIRNKFKMGEADSLQRDIIKLKEYMLTKILCRKVNAYDKKFTVLAVNAAEKIFRDTIFNFAKFPYKISAAGNECESFQVVVVPFIELQRVRVSASNLKNSRGNTIPDSAVTINPVGYVEIKNAVYYPSSKTGFWPDILLDNQEFDLQQKVQPYMLTVKVPFGQAPGTYSGTIKIEAENAVPQTVLYKVKVYNFSLPKRGTLKTFFSTSYLPSNKKIRKDFYDKYFSFRLSPTNMYARIWKGSNPAPKVIPPLEDISYCLENGMNFFSFGELLNRGAENIHSFDLEYINDSLKYIGNMRKKLIEIGAWKYAVINGFDEIMHGDSKKRENKLKEAVKICQAVKDNYPDAKIANVGRLMDISNKLMNWWFTIPMSREAFQHITVKGGNVGFYWVYENPSFMLDLPGIAPRICVWMAYKEKVQAIAYYSTYRPHALSDKRHIVGSGHCNEKCNPSCIPQGIDWNADEYNVESTGRRGRNCCGVLFYPDPNGSGRLLGSIRLINLRDGIEDYEYFKILEKKIGGKDKLKILSIPDDIVMVKGNYTRDYEKLQNYRDEIANLIEKTHK